MVKSKEMRAVARKKLKGHWIQAIGVCIFITLASMLIGGVLYEGISLLSGVITMIIVAPLTFGLDLYMLKISKREYKFSNLFEMFKSKMIWKSIVIQLIWMIGAIISLIPIIIMAYALISDTGSNGDLAGSITSQMGIMQQLIMIIVTLGILVALCIPFIMYSYSYAQIIYIVAIDSNMPIKDIFTLSRIFMRGQKWRMFRLQITYIGWYLISLLTIGVGFIWLVPYFKEGMAVFYNEISGVGNLEN